MPSTRPFSLFATFILLIGILSLITFSQLMNSVTIKSGGRVMVRIPFDHCDQIDDWRYTDLNRNALEICKTDRVEGDASLKGIIKPGYGGMFFKRAGLSWNLTKTPLMEVWMKINASIPGLLFELVTGEKNYPSAWNSFHYEILDQLTVGEWCKVVIDLRQPDYRPQNKLPYLAYCQQISFFTWEMINNPASINWDNITVAAGGYIQPKCVLTPSQAAAMVGESVVFSAYVLGGEPPYSYSWYVNETLQSGNNYDNFTFSRNTAGHYNVTVIVSDNQNNVTSATAWVTVFNSPPPQPPIPPSLDVFKSEIRGVFIQGWDTNSRNANWTRIAETCRDYGINTIVIEIFAETLWDNSQKKIVFNSKLKSGVDIFHDYGFKVHILTVNGLGGIADEYRAVKSDGTKANWLCFTKNASRQVWFAVIESLVKDYSVDGIMFDYIRWDGRYMCFCDDCKAKFIAETGLSDVNWPSDCIEGGRYYWQFLQWRINPITEFVRDASTLAKSLNPNILISAAVFTAFDGCGNYWVMGLGQHTADWVDKGYLDFVCPMIYSSDATTVTGQLLDSMNFYTGGAEGKIPMVPFITFLQMPDEYTPIPVQDFVNVVNALKQNGADGYIIWRYGGAGFENDPFNPKLTDIRPHLAGLFEAGLMQPIWAIQNLSAQVNGNYATISWTTTVPTNATIEYADGKIFYATIRYGDFGRPIYYKDIDYNSTDTKKITEFTWSTSHLFIIPITEHTQFRIRCTDTTGVTVTSKPILISP